MPMKRSSLLLWILGGGGIFVFLFFCLLAFAYYFSVDGSTGLAFSRDQVAVLFRVAQHAIAVIEKNLHAALPSLPKMRKKPFAICLTSACTAPSSLSGLYSLRCASR